MAETKTKTSRAAYWQEHISQWSGSGLTQAEYCRRNRLSPAAFNWLKRHLRRKTKAQKNPSASTQFVEVQGVARKKSPKSQSGCLKENFYGNRNFSI